MLAAWLGAMPAGHCDNWHGSVRTKVQVDNRYTREPRAFGELWGQFFYDDLKDDLHGAVDFVTRTGIQPDGGPAGQVYQAFIEKGFADFGARVKLGRFERTDNLGFYRVDGGTLVYSPGGSGYTVEVYAGRPSRIDHVRSVDGEFVGGIEGRTRLTPGWGGEGDWFTLETVDLRGGYQHFRNSADGVSRNAVLPVVPIRSDRVDSGVLLGAAGQPGAFATRNVFSRKASGSDGVDRLSFAGNAAGKVNLWRRSGYELGLLGTFRADVGRFENVLLTSQLDLTEKVRFRGSYEYYRPRDPFLTFREKFYSAYALGEQTLFRARIHHSPIDGLTYYVGGMGATRDGRDGYGGDLGGSYAFTPNTRVAAEFDYLGLGPEDAKSFYVSAAHTASSRLQFKFNSALRFERKQLYGDNRAVGIEGEFFYMIKNNMVLNLAGSYIWNTRLQNEYLGAVQFIYYFDNFQPKAM